MLLADQVRAAVEESDIIQMSQPRAAGEHDSFVTEVRGALPAPEVDYVRLEIDAVRR